MVNNLINAGMPSRKINLGVPFYGRLGATNTKSYDELREKSDRSEIKRRTKSLLFDWWFC